MKVVGKCNNGTVLCFEDANDARNPEKIYSTTGGKNYQQKKMAEDMLPSSLFVKYFLLRLIDSKLLYCSTCKVKNVWFAWNKQIRLNEHFLRKCCEFAVYAMVLKSPETVTRPVSIDFSLLEQIHTDFSFFKAVKETLMHSVQMDCIDTLSRTLWCPYCHTIRPAHIAPTYLSRLL